MVDRLSDDAVNAALSMLEWTLEGNELVKVVTKKDFAAAMQYVNAVAEMAEAVNHHPDIAISWNKVTLRLTSHDAGGLTQRDVDLAAGVDGLDST
jgi:4a-hydroxytetrahydrobiopterin dehydratase